MPDAPRDIRWHVPSSLNRTSIAEHGLDWRRMGRALAFVALMFASRHLTAAEMTRLARMPPDRAGEKPASDLAVPWDSDELVAYWLIEGDAYRPIAEQLDALFARVGTARAGLLRLARAGEHAKLSVHGDGIGEPLPPPRWPEYRAQLAALGATTNIEVG